MGDGALVTSVSRSITSSRWRVHQKRVRHSGRRSQRCMSSFHVHDTESKSKSKITLRRISALAHHRKLTISRNTPSASSSVSNTTTAPNAPRSRTALLPATTSLLVCKSLATLKRSASPQQSAAAIRPCPLSQPLSPLTAVRAFSARERSITTQHRRRHALSAEARNNSRRTRSISPHATFSPRSSARKSILSRT